MDFDKTQVMKQYGILSINKLEDAHVKSLTEQVKKEVKAAQEAADQVVNALTPGKKKDGSTPGPDFAAARASLGKLAKVAPNLLQHWSPFVRAVLEAMPPPADGEQLVPVDDDEMLGEIERQISKIGLSFPIAPTGALRVLDSSLGKLSVDLRDEMEKRGMPTPPKGDESGLKSMVATALADFDRVLTGKVDAGTYYTGDPGTLAEMVGRVQNALNTAHETRDEMGRSADGLEKQVVELLEKVRVGDEALKKLAADTAEATSELDAQKKAHGDLVHKLAEAKKRSGELEHELEALKKKSKSK